MMKKGSKTQKELKASIIKVAINFNYIVIAKTQKELKGIVQEDVEESLIQPKTQKELKDYTTHTLAYHTYRAPKTQKELKAFSGVIHTPIFGAISV